MLCIYILLPKEVFLKCLRTFIIAQHKQLVRPRSSFLAGFEFSDSNCYNVPIFVLKLRNIWLYKWLLSSFSANSCLMKIIVCWDCGWAAMGFSFNFPAATLILHCFLMLSLLPCQKNLLCNFCNQNLSYLQVLHYTCHIVIYLLLCRYFAPQRI